MHFPHNIIIQYTSFRSSSTPSTVNYHILYDEQREVFEKIDLKNMLSIEQSTSNLLLKLDVDIYDLSIEVIILGILNNLFAQSLPIDNINILTNNSTVIDNSYITKTLPLKDLICSFYQSIKNKGHFARDMKKITTKWEIALNKNHLAFTDEVLQEDDIKSLQENRIHNNNDKIDSHKHFSIEQTIYNSLYSLKTQNSDKFYFIYYRIGQTNRFYKFIMSKGSDYKNFQGVTQKYDNIRINFDEAEERCNLFYELEWNTLESLTKEQLEAIISNFVLIKGGQRKIKEYIENSRLQIFKKYDWNTQLRIATINTNKADSSYGVKCSEFCPFYENCKPIDDSMIETMKNRKPIEPKENTINYVSLEEARKELRTMIREAFWF